MLPKLLEDRMNVSVEDKGKTNGAPKLGSAKSRDNHLYLLVTFCADCAGTNSVLCPKVVFISQCFWFPESLTKALTLRF